MAEPRTRPLLSLPLLVLVGIAEALCPHCTENQLEKPQRWETPIHFDGGRDLLSGTRALVNLAATCKDLNAIVTPILYHQPQGHPKQRVSLLRTLDRRPDLARRVKVLRLDYDYDPDIENENDRAFILELVARYRQPTTPQPDADTEDDKQPDDKRVDGDFRLNLLLAMCPNLETFSTGLDYFYEIDLLRPASLTRLKDAYVAHRDTELGIHLESLRGLYLAAPHIETFTSYMTASVGREPLHLSNLRHLRLEQSAISAGCLRALLQSCPQLESFLYEAGGAHISFEQFSVRSLRKLLLRYVPRLKHLELDFQQDGVLSDDDDQEDDAGDGLDPDPAPGFASLSHLETLVVDPDILDNMHLDKHEPAATLFPQSLKSLLVTTHGYGIPSKIGGEEVSAFASSAPTLLPHLTVVNFRFYGKESYKLEYVQIL